MIENLSRNSWHAQWEILDEKLIKKLVIFMLILSGIALILNNL